MTLPLREQISEWRTYYRIFMQRRPHVTRLRVTDAHYMGYLFTYSPEKDIVHVHHRFLQGTWGSPSDYKTKDFKETIDQYIHIREEEKQKIRDWVNSFS